MQQTIHLLSDEAINQIAAGEVIESPASVVKELVENALDAKATKIAIEITGGGLRLIKVSDDGTGMQPEDARISVLRHATSKISKAHDLFHIATKGFRGEALASIASISKLKVETAQEGGSGTRLEVEKGEVVREGKCARMKGTTFEVASLFYNVPARKKFQKSPAAIAAEIFRIVTLMALSHPEVGFELVSNGRKVIKTLPLKGDFASILKERAEELLGKEFTAGCFPLHFQEESLEFFGLLGAPTNTRANKMGEYLFLNRRAVSCDPIYEAIREGYATRLEAKRHPVFLLYLDVPPDLVDVNVHPQKLQVRLRKEELFRVKVCEAVEGALRSKTRPVEVAAYDFTPRNIAFEEVSLRFQEEATETDFELPLEHDDVTWMGQAGRFLVFRENDELLLVDAKATRFRVLFEDLLSKMERGGEKQGLLVPFNIDLTPVEAAMVLTHMEAIESIGFALRPIGKEVFMVEAIPPFVDEWEVKSLVAELAHSLQAFIGKIDYLDEQKEKLALVAAQKAKGREVLSEDEAKQLLKQLKGTRAPLHSPKGDPTMVVLTHDTIEDLFRKDQEAAKADV